MNVPPRHQVLALAQRPLRSSLPASAATSAPENRLKRLPSPRFRGRGLRARPVSFALLMTSPSQCADAPVHRGGSEIAEAAPQTKFRQARWSNLANRSEKGIWHFDDHIVGPASEQSADSGIQGSNHNGLRRGDLCVCRDGNAGNQYLSALAADHGGRFARIERGRHVDDQRLPWGFCRRTIDCRTIVGPIWPKDADPGRTMHFRDWYDLVRAGQRSCKSADCQIDTGVRSVHGNRAFTCDCARSVRWAGACESHGVDDDRNRSRPRLLTSGRQRA